MRRRLLRPLYRNRRCGRFGFPILAWIWPRKRIRVMLLSRESLMTSLLRPKIAARTHWLYMCVLMETHTILPTIIRGRISWAVPRGWDRDTILWLTWFLQRTRLVWSSTHGLIHCGSKQEIIRRLSLQIAHTTSGKMIRSNPIGRSQRMGPFIWILGILRCVIIL